MPDWRSLFVPDVSLLEMVVRGTVTYLVLFFLFRVFRNRASGQKGLSDLLLIVLVADAVQSAMAGPYSSITDGIALALTIAFWAWLLNWIPYRLPWTRRFLRSGQEVVVRNGRVLERGMRREMLTIDDLREELGRKGVDRIDRIKLAVVEEDGTLTVHL